MKSWLWRCLLLIKQEKIMWSNSWLLATVKGVLQSTHLFFVKLIFSCRIRVTVLELNVWWNNKWCHCELSNRVVIIGKVIIVATLKGRIFWTYVVLSGLPSKISMGDNTGNLPLIFFGLMLVPFGKWLLKFLCLPSGS